MAIGTYASGSQIRLVAMASRAFLQPRWRTLAACLPPVWFLRSAWSFSLVVDSLASWQSADVRDTAHAAQAAATTSERLPSSPSSTSSSGTTLTRLLLPGLGCPWMHRGYLSNTCCSSWHHEALTVTVPQ